MKARTICLLAGVACLAAVVLLPAGNAAAEGGQAWAPAVSSQPASAGLPGTAMAEALSTVTGVAISPLLGVSAVGAWKYWRTPAERRARLPWFAQPWFWMGGLILVGLAMAKDVIGTASPAVLKKPFDVVEAVENKISALIAAGAFVPIIVSIFGPSTGLEGGGAASYGLAMIDGSSLLNALMVPAGVMIFAIVWLASHAVNILILLSPWGAVDAALKSARAALLSLLTVSAMANPWVGALVSLIVIAMAYCVAGWSFRLMVFGSVYSWDFLTLRRRRFAAGEAPLMAFTARVVEGVPVRSYGRIEPDENGRLALRYRPWLVLPQRTLPLPGAGCAVGQELLFPSLIENEDGNVRTWLVFPPRYRTHERTIARRCGLEVQDVGVRKGLMSLWRGLKELLGVAPRVKVQPA